MKQSIVMLFLLLLVLCSQLSIAQTPVAPDDKKYKDFKAVVDLQQAAKVAPTGQDTIKNWLWGANVALNVSQVALSNWAAGGNSYVGVAAVGALFARYEKKKLVWDVRLDLAYGIQKVGHLGLRKSDDQIVFNSLLGYQFAKGWQFGLLNNFRSTFDKGYDYPTDTTRKLVSQFFAPAYVIASVGIAYTAPKYFRAYLSPLTSKTTFVLSDSVDHKKYGVDSSSNVFAAFGAYFTATFTANIFKNVSFFTKVDLFSDYLKNPQDVSVIWSNKLTLKVNSFLNVNVTTDLLYDDNVKVPKTAPDGTIYQGKGTQFKENLAIGIGYLFDSKNPPKKKKAVPPAAAVEKK